MTNQFPPAATTGPTWETLASGASGDVELERHMLGVFHEAFTLWQQRHLKYGRNNISRTGAVGCAVSLGDKIARLEELYINDGGRQHRDESVTDSWLDALNYAAMGLLCERNWWPGLPARKADIINIRFDPVYRQYRGNAIEVAGMAVKPGQLIEVDGTGRADTTKPNIILAEFHGETRPYVDGRALARAEV